MLIKNNVSLNSPDFKGYNKDNHKTFSSDKASFPVDNNQRALAPLKKENVLAYFANKASTSKTSGKLTQKLNEAKILQMFVSTGVELGQIYNFKDSIKKMSACDFKNLKEKYEFAGKVLYKKLPDDYKHDLINLCGILEYDDLTTDELKYLGEMVDVCIDNSFYTLSDKGPFINSLLESIQQYENFDFLSTADQKHLIRFFSGHVDEKYILSLDDNNPLMKFSLIRDIKNYGSCAEVSSQLETRMKNKPVSSIEVDPNKMRDFVTNGSLSLESLKENFAQLDLDKYKTGFPLKYSRDKFISDFNNALCGLNQKEKKEVFDYYHFGIDDNNDIIKFPTPSSGDTSSLSPNAQRAVKNADKFVNDFVLNNEIILDDKDKKTEKFLNDFIKVFPEFISVIGKIQHRGDSIDNHTFKNLQLCLNNPEINDLSEDEISLLFFSVMFHDIAKKQQTLDCGHERPSAIYAKEIAKKIPISLSQKEQIYNLIYNSHWLVEGTSSSDLAAIFRHKNEFKIAQIMAKADSESSGFKYNPSETRIDSINSHLDIINSAGIPLFADNLPADTSKFPIDSRGVKYLDFTDKDADLTQYGFPEGTKVGDLNLLSHSSDHDLSYLYDICDDSKEICLSTCFLNAEDSLETSYNGGTDVILYSSNPDIALAGIHVGCTGGHRGFKHFKDYLYGENNCWQQEKSKAESNKKQRTEIKEFLKKELDLSDEDYKQLYEHLYGLENVNEIQDLVLKSGKVIDSNKILSALENMHSYLLKGRDNPVYYKNEVVVFQPKIQALVLRKDYFLNPSPDCLEDIETAKKNDIPVILV